MSEWFGLIRPRVRFSLLLGFAGLVLLLLWFGALQGRKPMNAAMMAQQRMPGASGEAAGGGFGGRADRGAAPQRTGLRSLGYRSGPAPVPVSAAAAAWPTAPLLIRTATLCLQVKDVAETYSRVVAIARAAGGYVADSSLNAERTASGATVTLRVPNDGLEDAVEQLASLGILTKRNVHAQEVTEEYVDLASRRRNLQREEARLLDFMEKAGRIRDLLSVEEEVARVHGDIETISGRMRYLENRVAFSTIEVELDGPHVKQKAKPKPGWSAPKELLVAYRSLRGTGQAIATVLIWTGVYLPVWLPIGLGLAWVVRREMHR